MHITVCITSLYTPADIVLILLLQCSAPFVGDGERCTLDSDGDLYPDVALDSPVCGTSQGMQENYCIQVRN